MSDACKYRKIDNNNKFSNSSVLLRSKGKKTLLECIIDSGNYCSW